MTMSNVVPLIAMVIVQFSYAGMNITSKLAIESGMHPLVLVAYRQIFATLSLAPFAYWLERSTAPRMTMPIFLQILLSSLTGVTANQVLYFVGLKYTTATITCALTNLLPAFTIILAVLFRQEYLSFKTKAGIAKVLGTLLSVGGALLLSFYNGKVLDLGESKIHWGYADKLNGTTSSGGGSIGLLGPLAVIASTFVWAIWFVVQANISRNFPAPYTSSFYMCFLASIQSVVIAVGFQHNLAAWSLHNTMRLTSALYAGIISTGLTYALMSWTIERKGALYASIFSPLVLVITAVISWAVLHEKLYMGTAIGSVVIVIGLYSALWGKSKEIKSGTMQETITDDEKDDMNDLELQPYNLPNHACA
ncbi:WAT1-related protein At1g09380-like [Lotus japonicus]|uniref:WAT1-related protein At1g09380-like n=1 Tax=Lotus japonicus TaxID=34305 RepID=UPI00258E0A42|nr:WAT1-related protein At1g09380-like [Lotus japonicus]